ncbi:hypothetical protein BD626DRAFT_502043 [Schizophyllum amplum]|uniref:Uncharacterized protein n=1 Tax=Schizophyllum amplum TaxID=97359 RepID=A0A550C908_9AGAR|nr:hypothetical protein BD626DRAFT_502043 [Auriculariopsis ampla]
MSPSRSIYDCPIAGSSEDMASIHLIDAPQDVEIPRMEWIWGLPRGGILYYLSSEHNTLYMRHDIARMFANYEFTLAPTFQTYVEIMGFVNHAGVIDRDEEDSSPRRPLTALTPPSGSYRYVFIPFTEAARELQKTFHMQPQTEDDLSGGIHPVYKQSLRPGSDELPIVECRAHPYSISSYALEAFQHHSLGTRVTAQWATCVRRIVHAWTSSDTCIPQWFLDTPKKDWDDMSVVGSEKLGYELPSSPNALIRTPANVVDILKLDQSEYPEPRAKVLSWFPKIRPPADKDLKSSRSPCKLRRSQRLKEQSSPYADASRLRRKLSLAARPRPCDFGEDDGPEWVQQNGHFPTHEFSSNDWAMFCYGSRLDACSLDIRDAA